MNNFDLYTIEDDGLGEWHVCHHVETSWPRLLKDMAKGFSDFPDIMELWFQSGQGVEDEVCLWRRK